MKLWIGEKFLLAEMVLLVVVVNYYLSGMRQSCIIYNTTLGLFWNDRYKPLFEAAINLVASIFLIKKFGMIGVFLGTVVSNLSTNVWVEPYLLYKYGFKRKLKRLFFTIWCIYFCCYCGGMCFKVDIINASSGKLDRLVVTSKYMFNISCNDFSNSFLEIKGINGN